MSGHSKWSTIKHKKAIEDNRRGKVFTKLVKAIIIAAREGGADLTTNFKLRLCVDKAKQANMPKKNIERAIEKGSGESGGEAYDEAVYEGYGQAKVAVIIEVVTDNKNRTASELKQVFDRSGGSLGQTGSVSFLFDKRGRIIVEKVGNGDDQMLELIDFGALDVVTGDTYIEILIEPNKLFEMKNKLDSLYKILEAELVYLPKNLIELEDSVKEKVINFLETLDDMDDVQQVYCNAGI
ncbi:MAG: YebC/PmpR family DNA-binding transcriptional regulator [Candidatus Beckwithbacteria bacterium]|nr:YebC/PmpR family DNA-binding transcriptional regulator [Patescibacteria group bacterium]